MFGGSNVGQVVFEGRLADAAVAVVLGWLGNKL
jgi:hypothetical protein